MVQNYNCRDEGGRATIDKNVYRPEAQGGWKKQKQGQESKKTQKNTQKSSTVI